MQMGWVVVIALLVLFITLAIGMHVGLALMFSGFVGYILAGGLTSAVSILGIASHGNATNYTLSVVPLFILMGNYAYVSGISGDLYDSGRKWLNWLPGGLACGTVASSALFGAICGSAQATAATMGTVAIPQMRKYGYADRLSTGCVAAGGPLGFLIPPSSSMILFASVAEESIGSLFISGIIPGLILAVLLIVTIVLWVKKDPSVAPEKEHFSWKERLFALKGFIGALILFGVVIGGMMTGLITTNEAAAVGCFICLVIMIINGKMHGKTLFEAIKMSVKAFGMSFMVIVGAGIFGYFITITQLPAMMSTLVSGLHVSKYIIIAGLVLIYIFLGCIMDGTAITLLTVPIFLPMVLSLGFSKIWFGVMVTLVCSLGQITPPVGLCSYVIAGVSKTRLEEVFRGCAPFIVSYALLIILVTAFPALAEWLPTIISY